MVKLMVLGLFISQSVFAAGFSCKSQMFGDLDVTTVDDTNITARMKSNSSVLNLKGVLNEANSQTGGLYQSFEYDLPGAAFKNKLKISQTPGFGGGRCGRACVIDEVSNVSTYAKLLLNGNTYDYFCSEIP